MRFFCLLLLVCTATQAQPTHRIEEVLDRLRRAAGLRPKTIRLELNGKYSNRIAYLYRSADTTPLLALDESLYAHCLNTFRDKQGERSDALLAFVVGHELAHQRLHHRAYRSFAEKIDESVAEHLSRRQEAEADSAGLLLAYLAGYDPQADLAFFFKKLYAWRGLPNELKGYPSLGERQRLALHGPEFRRLARLFQAGELLYAFGE